MKQKIIDASDLLKRVYKSADNPIFTIFCVEHGSMSMWSFATQTPKKFEF